MRARLRSLDFEVARLRPYDAEVGRLQGLLAKKEAKLTEGQQVRTSAEARAADYDHLVSQLVEKTEECIHLRAQQTETEAELANADIFA